MRRIIVFCILAYLVPTSGHAQGFDYGFKAGVSSSAVHVTDSPESPTSYNRSWGFIGEGFGEWQASPLFAVAGVVGYHQRGYEEVFRGRDAQNNVLTSVDNTRLDYLSLSVQPVMRFPVGSVQPFLLAGPRVDILVHKALGSVQREHVVGGDGSPLDSWLGSNYKSVAVGYVAAAGLGIDVPGPMALRLETRYGRDVTDNLDWDFDEIVEMSASNSSFDVLIGVTFPLH